MCDGWLTIAKPNFPTVTHVVKCDEEDDHRLSPNCWCHPEKEVVMMNHRHEPTMHVGGVVLTHRAMEP